MSRFYKHCSLCHRRLRLIAKSTETFGQPPTACVRYYHCPQCGGEYTFDIERNFMWESVPDHLAQARAPSQAPEYRISFVLIICEKHEPDAGLLDAS
jgi:hypothetical protein